MNGISTTSIFLPKMIRPVGGSLVAGAEVIGREVVAHQARVVNEAAIAQQLDHVVAETGAGRAVTDRAPSRHASEYLVAAIENRGFILGALRMRVQVAVICNLVTVGHEAFDDLRIGSRRCVRG